MTRIRQHIYSNVRFYRETRNYEDQSEPNTNTILNALRAASILVDRTAKRGRNYFEEFVDVTAPPPDPLPEDYEAPDPDYPIPEEGITEATNIIADTILAGVIKIQLLDGADSGNAMDFGNRSYSAIKKIPIFARELIIQELGKNTPNPVTAATRGQWSTFTPTV